MRMGTLFCAWRLECVHFHHSLAPIELYYDGMQNCAWLQITEAVSEFGTDF